MREVVSIHIGQAGVQIGQNCWELYRREHGIEPDGRMASDMAIGGDDDSFNKFFSENDDGKYVPRAVFLDLEPHALEGGYRQLFVREQLVWGKEGASSIYARGRQLGMNLIDSALTNIRELVEDCEILDGFILSHSHGGGTGSGLTSLLLERLRDEYHDKHLINFAIQPSQHISTAVVEPYNAILAMYDNMSIDNIATILLDNEAISNICNHLHDSPTGYTNMNHLISQCISSLTTGPRFGGKKQKGLIDTVSNLVPYPRIHYATTSYAPVISAERNRLYPPSVDEMTDACFSASNQMLKCQPSRGKYISGCIFGRGIEMGDLAKAAENTKVDRGVQQVDYSPSAFVLDTSERLPKNVSGSDLADVNQDVCMFSNTTAISETWKPLVREFDLMFPKRAFVHHYEEAGTEKHDFEQARDGMANCCRTTKIYNGKPRTIFFRTI